MGSSTSTRLSEAYKNFIVRLSSNRIIIKVDKKPLSAERASNLIVKYFKNNNDRYIELINMEEKK